jgi:hypothetical protein
MNISLHMKNIYFLQVHDMWPIIFRRYEYYHTISIDNYNESIYRQIFYKSISLVHMD